MGFDRAWIPGGGDSDKFWGSCYMSINALFFSVSVEEVELQLQPRVHTPSSLLVCTVYLSAFVTTKATTA